MIWIMNWLMIRKLFGPPQAMYVACWAFYEGTPLWFLYWYYWYGYGSGDCHLPVVLILMFTYVHQGRGTRILTIPEHPSRTIPSTWSFDLDMVHLTTLDRKIMGQMVRRRLRHAPCHCGRRMKKYASWGLVWHILTSTSPVVVESKIRGSWDVRLPNWFYLCL